ncbi:MAG: response regulator [Rhodospirillales bacterium]|jgi:CheY-like chemotaxis protein|nr:response regulator [Rhodospirillales bacterium]
MAKVDISKLHILVVDDEIFIRNLLVRYLEEIGTGQISSASGGAAALAALQKAQPKVDVILLDLEMPRVDGYEFIEKLHSDLLPPLSDTPVIVVSGVSNKTSFDRLRKLGVGLFLMKPVTPEHLVTRINAAVRQKIN